MERWEGHVALVTGASSGIGSAVAKDLVKAGMKVVGIGTRVENIEEIAADLRGEKGSLLALKCDLSSEREISYLFSTIKDTYGGVDVCVNNAGISEAKSLMDGTGAEWKRMLDVNVVALCLCSQLAIRSMRERGVDDGHVINISSLSGHRQSPVAGLHFYSATKYAVRAVVEGFRMEMREAKSRIRISSLSPGFVETGFALRMTNDPVQAAGLYSSLKCIEPKDISDTVLHILAAPPHVEINDVIIRPTEMKN